VGIQCIAIAPLVIWHRNRRDEPQDLGEAWKIGWQVGCEVAAAPWN